MTKRSLRAQAIDYLSRREHSRSELKQKLMAFEEDVQIIDALLDDLTERGWQSDSRYAQMMVHSKSDKHGNRRLQQNLALKGIDADLIADVLPSKDIEKSNAIQVIQKKFKTAPTSLQERAKQMRFLAYRGFGMDAIQAALNSWNDDETSFSGDFDDFHL